MRSRAEEEGCELGLGLTKKQPLYTVGKPQYLSILNMLVLLPNELSCSI